MYDTTNRFQCVGLSSSCVESFFDITTVKREERFPLSNSEIRRRGQRREKCNNNHHHNNQISVLSAMKKISRNEKKKAKTKTKQKKGK